MKTLIEDLTEQLQLPRYMPRRYALPTVTLDPNLFGMSAERVPSRLHHNHPIRGEQRAEAAAQYKPLMVLLQRPQFHGPSAPSTCMCQNL
jgi:hypothetical protein